MSSRIAASIGELIVIVRSLIYRWALLSSGWLMFFLPTHAEMFRSKEDDTRKR